MRSPTTRTLEYLRNQGAIAVVCEKWIPTAGDWKRGKRVDLFGAADVAAIQGRAFILIQSCSGGSHATRIAKCRANPNVAAYLNTGNTFEVWSWSKRVAYGKNGKKMKRKPWTPRVSQLVLDRDGKVTTADRASNYPPDETEPRHTLD